VAVSPAAHDIAEEQLDGPAGTVLGADLPAELGGPLPYRPIRHRAACRGGQPLSSNPRCPDFSSARSTMTRVAFWSALAMLPNPTETGGGPDSRNRIRSSGGRHPGG
jgi:hypothetical protein